jgi:hydrogenase maturation protein HypF
MSLGLSGYVLNSSAGVTIEIEGDESLIKKFLEKLRSEPPHLAEIAEVIVHQMDVSGDAGFSILRSRQVAGEFALVPTDAGTCEACWHDFGDRLNRRYGYPFTNCTHCGPRYTIIQDIPYDRAATTMSQFKMCSACEEEYRNPDDRRFHAQPNACNECGPSLALVPRGASLDDVAFTKGKSLPALREARMLLHDGKILALKGLGGFLLACDATNETAVTELRRRKRRPDKPFALMARDVEMARNLCDISVTDEASLLRQQRPIIVLPRSPNAKLAKGIAPANNTIGLMLPYTPLHYLLFGDSPEIPAEFSALVMTSGNLAEEPIMVSNAEALAQLDGVADWFLLHNREIATRVDDSVVRTFEGQERVLRRSRGVVPQAINLKTPMEEIIGFGGEMKNTFCLTKDHYAILSQHIGNMENYETMRFFEETFSNMKRVFHIEPKVAAYDLHPDYRSTKLALVSGIERKIGVQHHHAHIASCMAENQLCGRVIGVAFDGTGFGTDGKVWGGEFLVADYARFERRAHLRNVLLPGGDAAVWQPWRMARSYLQDTFGEKVPNSLHCFRDVPEKQLELVDAMISKSLHSVETSSSGRLFDAVAALVGIGSQVTFEGQAAISLESIAALGVERRYDFHLQEGDPTILDFRPMISALVKDLRLGKPAGDISSCFHNTLSEAIAEVCFRIKKSDGLDRVCLSGGTFQNFYLLDRTVRRLRACGFGVFLHAKVPCNDGGISLGQAVIANERMQQGE